jgi:hypothetical protein
LTISQNPVNARCADSIKGAFFWIGPLMVVFPGLAGEPIKYLNTAVRGIVSILLRVIAEDR